MKNQPRGLEGTFRTAAEMERHRAQLADAAIEEQLEVQTAFREHGARLQVRVCSAAFVLFLLFFCWVLPEGSHLILLMRIQLCVL